MIFPCSLISFYFLDIIKEYITQHKITRWLQLVFRWLRYLLSLFISSFNISCNIMSTLFIIWYLGNLKSYMMSYCLILMTYRFGRNILILMLTLFSHLFFFHLIRGSNVSVLVKRILQRTKNMFFYIRYTNTVDYIILTFDSYKVFVISIIIFVICKCKTKTLINY